MNDFTKEELQQIRGGLDWWLDNEWISSHVLVQKIQSMIDKYCEHKWVTNPRIHFLSNPAQIKCVCVKCKKYEMKGIIDE